MQKTGPSDSHRDQFCQFHTRILAMRCAVQRGAIGLRRAAIVLIVAVAALCLGSRFIVGRRAHPQNANMANRLAESRQGHCQPPRFQKETNQSSNARTAGGRGSSTRSTRSAVRTRKPRPLETAPELGRPFILNDGPRRGCFSLERRHGTAAMEV